MFKAETVINEELSIRRLVDKYKQNRIVVKSMAEDKAVASSETYKTKDILKKHGARWDGQFKAWYWSSYNHSDVDEMARKAAAAVDEANKLLGDSSEQLSKFITAYNDIKTLFEKDTSVSDDQKTETLKDIEKFIKDLAEETDMVVFDEKVQAFFEFMSTRRGYSMNNTILIFMQKPSARDVRSKTGWKKIGYELKDNPQGIILFRPPLRPPSKKELDERRAILFKKFGVQSENQLNPLQKIKFKRAMEQPVVMMRNSNDFIPYEAYDITEVIKTETGQTAADATKDFADVSTTDDEVIPEATELKKNIVKAMENNGITVEFNDEKLKAAGAHGYSANGTVVLSQSNQSVGQTRTAAHEFAHELLHWGVEKIQQKDKLSPKNQKRIELYNSGSGNMTSKQIMELQAEAIGQVVLKHYGFNPKGASTYLALFDNDRKHIMDNMEIIKNTANFIIDEVDEATEGDAKRPLSEEVEGPYSIADVAQILGVKLPDQRTEISEAVNKMNTLFENLMRPRWTM